MATEGTGKTHARGLGVNGGVQGWKVSPSIRIEPGERRVLGEINRAGAIQQIWLTSANLRWRDLILRNWWDDQANAIGRRRIALGMRHSSGESRALASRPASPPNEHRADRLRPDNQRRWRSSL
jgi:hypothetical protein